MLVYFGEMRILENGSDVWSCGPVGYDEGSRRSDPKASVCFVDGIRDCGRIMSAFKVA